ncbi:MAG: hypothetical protein ABI181_03740 [Mycobacteriaceae bacterium]
MSSVAAVTVSAMLLAGCGGSTDPGADAPATSVSPGATTAAATTAAPPSTAATTTVPTTTVPTTVAPTSVDGPAFVADTRDQAGEPRGQSEVVTGVRASTQAGYEQVVFAVKGEPGALPGFRVGYVESPEADPSGKPVQVQGKAYLQVYVTGVSGTPPPAEIVTGTFPGTGSAVAQVVVGPAFEGMHQFFIGVDQKRPFRVRAGADPGQVVVQLLAS